MQEMQKIDGKVSRSHTSMCREEQQQQITIGIFKIVWKSKREKRSGRTDARERESKVFSLSTRSLFIGELKIQIRAGNI